MNICVIGTGYVGLVAGTCFAEYGNQVRCVDNNPAKIGMLRDGKIPIYEPGLEELVLRNQRENRLSFTTSLEQAVRASDAVFVAVGTPSSVDGEADLSMVLEVAGQIGAALNGYKVIVNKSTVPVGTAELVRAQIRARAGTDAEFDMVSNPEFMKEGVAINDFMRPERVVVGCDSPRARAVMEEMYAPFLANGNPLLVMDILSAEITKYACNSFLALKISFANEIANLCDRLGAEYANVRRGLGTDSRIGNKFLYAGLGYGGSCFPKDVRALTRAAAKAGYPLAILSAVEGFNEKQKTVLLGKIAGHFGDTSVLRGRAAAVWGLAFKPGTDDMREAPSIPVIEQLLAWGMRVRAFDPAARETAHAVFKDRIEYAQGSCYNALEGADLLIICTEWPEFRRPDFGRMRQAMREPLIFDGRNLYEKPQMKNHGFRYYTIGNGMA